MAANRNTPTLRDIAQACNMDVSTVSRALRGDVRVKVETATKIRELAQNLGYRPNLAARSLAAGKTSTIMFIISNLSNNIELHSCEAASNYLRECEYDMFTTTFNRDLEVLNRMFERLGQGIADGAILIPGGNEPIDIFNDLHRNNIPLVMVDRNIEGSGLPLVTTDNTQATIDIVEMCAQRGCTDIVYVNHFSNNSAEQQRMNGTKQAAKKLNLRWHESDSLLISDKKSVLGIISSSHQTIHDFLSTHHSQLHGLDMYFGVFDFWYGEPFPAKAVMLAIQNSKEIAHQACQTLLEQLNSRNSTTTSPAAQTTYVPLQEIQVIEPKF